MRERLAVVVPVYNEPRIALTLEALYEQTHQGNTHHYVVDNASTDDTKQVRNNQACYHCHANSLSGRQ